MTIERAFTYVFSDRDWVVKLIIGTIVTVLTFAFTPVLIGLVGLALIFGYQSQLIRNVRAGDETPLPEWANIGGMISEGAGVVLAYFVYMLPNFLLGIFSFFVSAMAGDTQIVSSATSVGIACCLFPFILLYNLAAMPMFTIAQGRYSHTRDLSAFFQFAALFDQFRTHFDSVVQWWIGIILAMVVLSVVFFIPPFLGWFVTAALIVPITGALAAMLHLSIDGGEKKKKRAARA